MSRYFDTRYTNAKRWVFALIIGLLATLAHAERLKDLATIQGIRANQLVGYGLIVGLDGTGDQTNQTPFTVQTFKNMMVQFGIILPEGMNPTLKNVAAVSISAELPAFAKPGQSIDVTVSSIGNAKSLRGGTLLMTPLKGADGHVYAIAQGNLVVGGFGAEGKDGSKISVNLQSVGRIPNGATIEKSVANSFASDPVIIFNLNQPDFTTAERVSIAVNKLLGSKIAQALDATSVKVIAPTESAEKVLFISQLENLEIQPGEGVAKVVVNARTGTVVIGKNVRLSAAAVSHGNLSVTISEAAQVSQPTPLSKGSTVVTPSSSVTIEKEDQRMFLFNPGVSLGDLVRAVNQVGAAPGDLVAILEALKQAGALKAELLVI